MNSSNVKSSDSSSEKSDRENTSTVPLNQVQIALRSGAKNTKDGKSSGEQMKTVDSSQSGFSSTQPVGAGRPQTNMQKKQQNQKKTSGEHLQKGPRKIERSDNSGISKLCNNQQKVGSPNNLSRGSSQNSLTGKMNSMSISDPQEPIQNEFQKNSSSAGNESPNHQNRQLNTERNQNNWQHQPQGMGQFTYSANSRTMKVLHNQPSNGHFSSTPHSRNSGSPAHSMQMQAFPPLPYPGIEMGGPHRSAPNSPGPINPLAGQHLMYPGPPLTRSPSLPGQEHFQSEYRHNQIGLVGIKKGYGNYPTSPLTDGTLVNNTSFVSPPVSYGTHGKFHDFHSKDLGSQSNFYGKKSLNEAVMGNQSSDGHSQKKQGNKTWKKNNNSQPTPPVGGKRQTYPARHNATKYNGPMEPINNIVGRMRIPDHPQCVNNQEVFVGQHNFMPPLHSVPMLSPVTAPFQQYVDAQQYTVEFYQGAHYLPPQQWVPMNGGQSNFVPYTSAQIVPFTMGPGVIPHSTVPYSVPPNVVPYANVPNIVPFTNEANVVPYTAIPITSGVSGHGFVPPVPPPGPANVNSQVLSFTVSSRVGPFTAATEVPEHQFNLSQLERAWENPTHQKFEASSQNQSKETALSSDDGPSNQNAKTADEGHQRKGPEWLPDKLKKMLDVSSLEKLQRMSSTNGKRVPMNARNKESPNHLPTASPPDVQEEVIKFICDSWNKVYQEYQKGSPAVAFHVDSDPCALPEGFVPFDLEAYWGMRQVQNMSTQNIPTQNM